MHCVQGLDSSALALAAAQAQAAEEKEGDADDDNAEAGEVQHTVTVIAASNVAVYSQIMLGQMEVAQHGMMVAPAGLPAAAVSSPSLANTAMLNDTSTPAEYSQIMLGQMEIAQYGLMVTPSGLPAAAAVSSPSLAHTALLNGTNSTTTPAEYYSDNDETEDLSQASKVVQAKVGCVYCLIIVILFKSPLEIYDCWRK